MQRSLVLSLFSTACLQVDALSLHKRDAPAVVRFDIQRSEIDTSLLQKRTSTINVPFQNGTAKNNVVYCLLPLSRWTA